MGLALIGGPSWSVALRCRQAAPDIIADRGERFQRHVSGALDGPFLGLLHEDRADEASDRCLVRKDTDDVRASLDLGVQPLDRIGAVQLGAMLGWEGHIGQDVLLGRVHERRQFGELAAHLVRHEAPLGLRRRMVGLGEGRGDEGRDHPAAVLAGMGERIALEVDAAALPGRGQDSSGGGLDALMRIANHQFHATEAAPDEIAQELGPKGFGFGGTDRHAQHLAPAVGVDAHRERDRHGYDPPALAHLEIGGIDPEVGPFALDRPRQEGVDTLVDLLAQAAHLALRYPGPTHGLHQVVHRSR